MLRSFGWSALLAAACMIGNAPAQDLPDWEVSRENLRVVLRESIGANKPAEGLVRTGERKATLPDGSEVQVDFAWFEYVGDMHIRFVFDGAQTMRNVTYDEIERLKLSPAEALELSVANIKRVYGMPESVPWGGIKAVQGDSPDFDSSYFLDRSFWRGLAEKHPDGLAVGVPQRGALFYAPARDRAAVDQLRRAVNNVYSDGYLLRLSAALYLFKDDKWSVLEAAPAQTIDGH